MLYQFYYVVLLGIPLLVVGVAVWVDLRSRRGYGLAILAAIVIGLSVWAAVAIEQAASKAQSSESLGIGVVAAAYFLIGCYLALLLWIGALIEAGAARQGWWLVGLVVAAVLPGLIILADNLLNLGARGFGFGDIELALIVFLPTVTVLAHGIRRVIWPLRRVSLWPAQHSA